MRRGNKGYRKVKVVLELNTAATPKLLKDKEEWERVFAWAQPGDVNTDQEHFSVLSVKVEE